MSDTALQEAKRRLILPALLHQLGLGQLAKKTAKCPFHDDGHNSFSVFRAEGGAWFWKCFAGCGQGDEITFLEKHEGISTGEAIKLFREMAECAPVSTPKRQRSAASYQQAATNNQAANGPFDWQACVDALTESDLERLGNERWLSRAFCSWLHNSKLIGKHGWYVAFPNGNGEVKGAHVWRGEKDWYHHPSGVGTHPFVIGDLKRAKQVHLFESQWDMLAFADRCGNYEAQGVAFVATRGASNAALVKDRLPQGASVVAWPQADAAGEKWLSDLSAFVPKLGVARVPASIKKRNEFGDIVEMSLKDMNDWTKAGASAAELYVAFWRNELFKPKPIESEPVSIEQSPSAPAVASAKQPVPSAKLQGEQVIVPDVEPWPDAVNGAEVLNEVADTFSRYCVLPEGAREILALWCAYTHHFEAFQCSPRLRVTSPEKGCGKTTVRDVIGLFVSRPLMTESVTVAVLFRLIGKDKPTVLADEIDAHVCEKNEDLRCLLNSGHRRGGKVYRCEGDGNEVRGFKVFAPVVLCGLGKLPETLVDRSIVIELDRAIPGELQVEFDSNRVEKEKELCRKVARFIADNKGLLEACKPALPEGVYNRLADKWRPLFAVAEIAGGEWPARAEAAFRSLTKTDDTVAQGSGVALLSDIRDVFDGEEMFSHELIEELCSLEESPWKEFGHARKQITPRQLASRLKTYKVYSRDIHLNGKHAKGYKLSDFQNAFKRYLPSPTPSIRASVRNIDYEALT